MRFELVWEKVEPQIMAYARNQGGIITLGQIVKVVGYHFGTDDRTVKKKLDILMLFNKLEPDISPGQFIVTEYKPKKDNGHDHPKEGEQ